MSTSVDWRDASVREVLGPPGPDDPVTVEARKASAHGLELTVYYADGPGQPWHWHVECAEWHADSHDECGLATEDEAKAAALAFAEKHAVVDTVESLARWMAETVRPNYDGPPPLENHVREIESRLRDAIRRHREGAYVGKGNGFGPIWDFARARIDALVAAETGKAST